MFQNGTNYHLKWSVSPRIKYYNSHQNLPSVDDVAKQCSQDKTKILHLLACRQNIPVSQYTQATVTEISPISWRDSKGVH